MRVGVLIFGFATLSALVAFGQAARAADDTFVSATGADAGDCQIAAPCATLRHALAQTTPGGTITVLTSGRYGWVNITKSVHIMAEGVVTIVTNPGSCGAVICVNAGPDDVISLHGLNIEVPPPYKPGPSGIAFNSGGALHLERCQIGSLQAFGVTFYPHSSAHLHVFDSKIGGGGKAVDITSFGGDLQAVFDRVEVRGANEGITFQNAGSGTVHGTVRNSLISAQYVYGIWLPASTSNSVPVSVMVDRSVIANGEYGVQIGSNTTSTIRIGDTTISGQDSAPVTSGGAVLASYGNNRFLGGPDGIPVSTVIPLK